MQSFKRSKEYMQPFERATLVMLLCVIFFHSKNDRMKSEGFIQIPKQGLVDAVIMPK